MVFSHDEGEFEPLITERESMFQKCTTTSMRMHQYKYTNTDYFRHTISPFNVLLFYRLLDSFQKIARNSKNQQKGGWNPQTTIDPPQHIVPHFTSQTDTYWDLHWCIFMCTITTKLRCVAKCKCSSKHIPNSNVRNVANNEFVTSANLTND